jgi:hypothetical protein
VDHENGVVALRDGVFSICPASSALATLGGSLASGAVPRRFYDMVTPLAAVQVRGADFNRDERTDVSLLPMPDACLQRTSKDRFVGIHNKGAEP